MRVLHGLQTGAIALACLGLLIPTVVLEAAEPDRPQIDTPANEFSVQDIALAPGGVFRGQVIDPSGKGKPGVQVVLSRDNNQIAATLTDAEGRFAVSGLRGGVVQVAAGENSALYRLWAPNTAPPVAHASALIVDQQIVRGQSPIVQLLYNPLVILGLVATAVAVPLAVHHFKSRS
jgi:hypothetical protein